MEELLSSMCVKEHVCFCSACVNGALDDVKIYAGSRPIRTILGKLKHWTQRLFSKEQRFEGLKNLSEPIISF